MAKNREELIDYYTERLKKVKSFHDPEKAVGSLSKERCLDYIKFAKKELRAVKNGRDW